MSNWLLPESLADILPAEARRIEELLPVAADVLVLQPRPARSGEDFRQVNGLDRFTLLVRQALDLHQRPGQRPGNQRSQTGAAQTSRYGTAPENNALRGETVKMGRLHLRMPHESVIAPVMVIRDDKNDIGGRRGRSGHLDP